jgi:hypothetical protein
MIFMIIGFVFMLSTVSLAQNAPITIAPVIEADSGTIATVPVLVSGFNAIGAISLRLNYDPAVLIFQSFIFNPGFPGLSFGNATPGVINIAGFTSSETGISLTDNTVLFTLTFAFSGGSTGLIWIDNGSSCEYSGPAPLYSTLNDNPQSTYYLNGSVSGFPLPGAAGPVTGPLNGNVCAGQAGVLYSIAPIPDATGYVWAFPSGATITAGANTSSIVVSYNNTAVSGNITVFGTNQNGSGVASPPFPVVVNVQPSIVTQPVSPNPVYAGAGIAFFEVSASGSVLTYQWQEFSSAWNNLADAGNYSGSYTDSLLVTNPPLAFNGYKYRCIISGLCEPQVVTDGNATLTVSAFPLPAAAGNITGPLDGMVCAGETGVVFSVFPIPEATGYVWILPFGASITDGYNTNQITVSFSNNAITGFVTVYGTNSYGFGPLSPAFSLTINSPPIIDEQPQSPAPIYAGSGIAVFTVSASGSGLNYQWQEFQTDWGNVTDGEYYSGALTENLVVLNPPISFNGNKYRCIIGGQCEPQAITDGNAILTVNVVLQSDQQPVDENNLMQLKVSPNPCKMQAVFSYFLDEDCILALDFVNLIGETVRPISHLSGRQGWNKTTVETNQLKPGIYSIFLHTTSGDSIVKRTVKLIILP